MSIVDVLLGRNTLVQPLDEVHQRLQVLHESSAVNLIELDAALNECTDPECYVCSEICCPYSEWLHYHHDVCPACHSESMLEITDGR